MASINKTNQSGFTLVELAIALMIIGLLIGGVLKGIELVENARVTQVMRNVKAYETAMTSFQSIYSALPGDINSPDTRLPNCVAASQCAVAGNANGMVQDADPSGAPTGGVPAGVNTTLNVPATSTFEARNFWLHLAVTGLISGVDSTGTLTSPTGSIVWGREFPASPVIGAGFVVQNVRRSVTSATAPYVANARFQGHYAVLRGANVADGVLTGNQALQIDTKFDDAAPGSGDIVVAADQASATTECINGSNYEVNSDVKACVLFLRLSK